MPGWNDLGVPKSNRSKVRKPVTKGNKAKNTKRSNGIRKIHSSSSESESSDELSSKSDSSVTTKSSSSSSSNAYSSDSDDSSAPPLPPRKPPTPNLTLQNQKPVPSHSSRPENSDSESSTVTPMLSRKPTPPPPIKSFMSPPTPILKKQSPYSDPLWLETEATNQTSLSRKVSTPLRSTPGSAGNKLLSYVSSSVGFGGGTVEVPRESDEDNDEDGSNPEETVAEISGAGEHPPGEEMYGEVGSRVSVDFPIDVSKEDSSKTKKKKKKKQRSAEVDSDDSDENSESTTNTTEKKKHDTSSKKKKKKKSSEDMDASKNKNTVSKKKSGKKDDGEPVRVRRSRRNKK